MKFICCVPRSLYGQYRLVNFVLYDGSWVELLCGKRLLRVLRLSSYIRVKHKNLLKFLQDEIYA